MTDTNQWLQQAACRGLDPDLFYPDVGGSAMEARAVCTSCPVIRECFDDVMATETQGERHGVIAGMIPKERAAEYRRARGKTPRQRVIEHNTERGYNAHRANGEEACDGCKKAVTRANLRRKHERRWARLAAPRKKAS